LEIERAHEVLRRAEQAAARDPQARSVRQWFAILVDDNACTATGEPARHELTPDGRDPVRPAPGRQTLVMRELTGSPRPARAAPRAPGRQTLVMLEAQREDEARQAPEP
jgi:hypothetical protein